MNLPLLGFLPRRVRKPTYDALELGNLSGLVVGMERLHGPGAFRR